MGREMQEPTFSEDGFGSGTRMSHPAFGQISVSRVRGQANLYGSDFTHHNYVSLAISTSSLRRDLSNDWTHPDQQIIEIAMSEAQWATFVSSFNAGSGVPCTLTWLRDIGLVPGIINPPARQKQFAGELSETMEDALEQLKKLSAKLEDLPKGMSKKTRDELIAHVNTASRVLNNSVPYVVDQFEEHMENESERAKVEIHSYASTLFTQAGIAALAGGSPIALVDHTQETTEDE